MYQLTTVYHWRFICTILYFHRVVLAEYDGVNQSGYSSGEKMDTETSNRILSGVDDLKSPLELLDVITNLTGGVLQCHREIPIPVKFNTTQFFPDLIKASSWVTRFLVDYMRTSGQNFDTPLDKGFKFLHRSITNLFDYEKHLFYVAVKLPQLPDEQTKILELHRSNDPTPSVRHKTSTLNSGSMDPEAYEVLIASNYHVYYSCATKKWLSKFSFSLNLTDGTFAAGMKGKSLSSVMVLAVDISAFDIYQCDAMDATRLFSRNVRLINQFAGSASCHKDTNDCIFHTGQGWIKNSYSCVCKEKYFRLPDGLNTDIRINNTQWGFTTTATLPTLSSLGTPAECQPCPSDCDICTNSSPCFYTFNHAIRVTLICLSSLCIIFMLILGIFTHKYRRVKVIRVASPKFLCFTLLGAAVMYSEMIAIYFEDRPTIYICMAIEWTRHLGFLVTYSSLFMKTWRISGLFRVKSAHKIKLSDKQLLQWMCPIILIMIIYLAAWSAGAPAAPELLRTENGLKYFQCAYGWWDHCLVVGNVIFLVWGIRVCYRVRKAQSYFNEAKFISIAIYNIAGVNAIFLLLHLVVYPQASPDIKFVFAFIRVQLSTSVTVFLIFAPKVFAIMRGEGENFEFRDRPGAQIPLNNGGPISQDEVIDVYQENEDLKDEIQKLASQIEWMKTVHMNIGNRHLKFKHSSAQYHLASTYFPPSPILRSLRRRSSDTPDYATSRLSPAAELASERV